MQFEPLYRLRYCLRHPLIRAGVIALLAMLSVCLIVLLAWWGPMKLEQWQSLATLDGKRKAWQEAKRTAEISDAYLKAKTSADLLEDKLHEEMNQAQAVQNISQLAARQKVRVISQAFDTDRKQGQVETMYIDLTVLGSYKGIRGMLSELPAMKGWVEVLEAHFEHSTKDVAQVKARLTLAVYHDTAAAQDRGGK